MNRPAVLLLDVMGTLVTEPFFTEVPRFFQMSLEQLLAQKNRDAWIEFEKGAIDEACYLRSFFLDGRTIDGPGLRLALTASYQWMDGMESLLTRLVGKAPLYALSNYSVWYQLIDEKLSLSRYLDGSFVSYQMGVRKPDPEAYLIPARTLGVDPAACLFIDDRESNCEAARRVQMQAVRFEGARSLEGALVEHGLGDTN